VGRVIFPGPAQYTVQADEYPMFGDDRDNSEDSRYIGFVKRQLLTGHAAPRHGSASHKHALAWLAHAYG